jgi:hypothetical protein
MPWINGQKISSTEMSNEMLVTASQAPGAEGDGSPSRSSMASKNATTERCLTQTPLGLPVEPDV